MSRKMPVSYERFWSPVFDMLDDFIYIVDSDFTVVRSNRAFDAFDGKKHLSSRLCSKAVCYTMCERTEMYVDTLKKWFEVRIKPLLRDNDEITGAIHLITDITVRKNIEESLRKTQKYLNDQSWGLERTNHGIKILYKTLEEKTGRLEELDKMRNDFISYIVHDLRTPLTPMKEALSHIVEGFTGKVNESQEKLLSMCLQQTGLMNRLISNLLDIAKMEAGYFQLARDKVDINHLVHEASDVYSSRSLTKGVELKVELLPHETFVYADRDRVFEVLSNLLSNAFKFTDKGSITVSLKQSADRIACSVSDTGRGISEEYVPRLFDKFQQVGKKSKEKGTGLGLPIAKGIVELHGGSIGVKSVPDKGTTFTFTLPVYRKELDERLKKNILIVDDDRAVRDTLARILRGEGYDNVLEARDGKQALAETTKKMPDLLILDMNMQGMSGYEVIGRLKEENKTKNIPIIIVSGYAVETGKIEEYMRKKAIPIVSKPFDSEQVIQMVNYLLY